MIMTSADGLTVWYAHMYMPLEFTICPLMDCSLWLVIASAPVLCHRFIIFEFREQQVWVTIFSTISCGGARLFYAEPFFFFLWLYLELSPFPELSFKKWISQYLPLLSIFSWHEYTHLVVISCVLYNLISSPGNPSLCRPPVPSREVVLTRLLCVAW